MNPNKPMESPAGLGFLVFQASGVKDQDSMAWDLDDAMAAMAKETELPKDPQDSHSHPKKSPPPFGTLHLVKACLNLQAQNRLDSLCSPKP